MLLALIDEILVLADRRRFETLAIDKIKLRKVRACSIRVNHNIWGPGLATI